MHTVATNKRVQVFYGLYPLPARLLSITRNTAGGSNGSAVNFWLLLSQLNVLGENNSMGQHAEITIESEILVTVSLIGDSTCFRAIFKSARRIKLSSPPHV